MDVLFPALSGFLRHLEVVLGDRGKSRGSSAKTAEICPPLPMAFSEALYLFVVYYSRQSHVFGAPSNYLYLEVGGSLLCFCYAANALVRFRGTHDRIALILAFGFVLSGMIETIGYFGLNNLLRSGTVALSHVPMGWMVGRTMLAVSSVGRARRGTLHSHGAPAQPRNCRRSVCGGRCCVHHQRRFHGCPSGTRRTGRRIPFASLGTSSRRTVRPCRSLFLSPLSTEKKNESDASLYDYSLFLVALLNAACHAAALFSQRLFDGPFFFAELNNVASYAIMLGAALIDQARLFEQVRSMAISDPLQDLPTTAG